MTGASVDGDRELLAGDDGRPAGRLASRTFWVIALGGALALLGLVGGIVAARAEGVFGRDCQGSYVASYGHGRRSALRPTTVEATISIDLPARARVVVQWPSVHLPPLIAIKPPSARGVFLWSTYLTRAPVGRDVLPRLGIAQATVSDAAGVVQRCTLAEVAG